MIESGVTFTYLHSFRDLELILAPFTPTPAQPKTTYIDIPGSDGQLDLTEAHGEIRYKNRDFTFVFTVAPTSEMTFDEKVTQISDALNGRKRQIILDRDPEYYWWGRLTVNEYLQDKNLKQITITAVVEPYKYRVSETSKTFALTETAANIILNNGRKSVVPLIDCTADNTVITCEGGTFALNAGTHRLSDIMLHEGENILTLSGSGEVTFRYREGEL